MKFIVYPYKMFSQASKFLAEQLHATRVKPNGRYRPRDDHFVINWGNNEEPTWQGTVEEMDLWYLNHPSRVAVATDKLQAYVAMKAGGVKIPDFTIDRAVASRWEGPIVARTILRGHGGAGVYTHNVDGQANTIELDDPRIKIYSKYIKKTAEYRVHVFAGEVWDVQQKKKRQDVDGDAVNFQVRNFNNGWVFCREGVEAPPAVTEEAIKALDALELDFGAVDIVWNRHHGAYVLEVNTAPGIEGTTLERYVAAFNDYVEQM